MSESGVKCQRGELYRFLSGRFEHARLDHGEETSSGYRCVSGLDKSNPIIRIKLLVIGAATIYFRLAKGRVGKYGRSAVNWSSLVFHYHIILRRLVTPALESLSRMGCSLQCFITAAESSSFCGTLKSLFMCLMRNSPSDC